MKVVLHGAINSSNFGDVLFARLIYKKCMDAGFEDVDFIQMPKYGVGACVRKELAYMRKLSIVQMINQDVFIFIPGGYFGDNKGTRKESITRFLRYILPAAVFALTKKPIYIIGVGGGPICSPFLRKCIVKLWNKAAHITVRDEETAQYFRGYGVSNDITVTSDVAQVLTESDVPEFEAGKQLRERFGDKKLVLLHLVTIKESDEIIAEKIVPALKTFLSENPDYALVTAADGIFQKDTLLNLKTEQALNADEHYLYEYHDCMQFCALLNTVSFIITTKLHTGVVGAAMGKSVISFPAHREKTERYYRQIGEAERCVHIRDLTREKAYSQINKFYDKPITLSSEICSLAESNLHIIDEIC